MPHTISAADAAELAVVERSGFVESRHIGSAIVLSPDGQVVRTVGDVSALILPRSSFKPIQALGSLAAGAWLDSERLALATASHSGTNRHVEVVREILETARLTEDALGCPPSWPTDSATRAEMIRDRAEPARIRMNCSGKHAAMLLACSVNGWDTATYLDPSHPLQVQIREVAERLTGEKMAHAAIDGCGAPVYAVSLTGLARAAHRIGTSSTTSPFALHRNAGTLVQAVRDNPWAIQGPGQPDTIAIERAGVFSKYGAEGVIIMTAPNGATVAAKTLDGSNRVSHVVALALLEQAGALPATDVAAVTSQLSLTISGGSHDVGIIRPVV
ncbi:L-asparaginase II [Microbacterium halimionae]|uniref:L-asparaginase II n=1 Tax=Microbacterium halimionae TaxID=1526413 RepID=A0A7W3JPE0_9MICO|nr:asparaginase [Microbacterium halimionae]MBA8816514.1 L-asparaginase II [Microbacterium halimionae]NII95299.1 L-asparaginase II [Microbacterium halimionae]